MSAGDKPTCLLIQDIISVLDNAFSGSSVTDLGGGIYQVFTDNTLWLTKGRNITLDGTNRLITDIAPNEWIKVSGGALPQVLTAAVYSPIFWHGTVKATNEELKLKRDNNSKYCMIYLHEIVREQFITDPSKKLDRVSTCDIYFMVDFDRTKLTDDHYRYAIRPMRNLAKAFWNAAISLNSLVHKDELEKNGYELLDHARWGRYIDLNGHSVELFDDPLSGTHMKTTIPFLKKNCPCC
jgi:hypothetical protein